MKKWIVVIIFAIFIISCGNEIIKEETVRPLGDQLVEIERDYIETNFAFPGGKWKALILSFDDGCVQDRQLVELMNSYGVKGTFHLNSGKFNKTETWDRVYEYISSNEVVELYEGHEISCHGVNHANLNHSSYSQIYREIVSDKQFLEELTGVEVRGMSYAFGVYNNEIFDVIVTNGIEYGRTTAQLRKFRIPKKFHIWKFSGHHSKATNLMEEFLFQPDGIMSLLSIWGHSWEFEDNEENNNWVYIESFLSNIGGREDIWYGSMIELVDYINAVSKVSISGEGVISNPSAMEVWVANEDGLVSVKPESVYP